MIISMKNVHYKRQGKTILEDINWEFRKGERWAILGLNGAGKSTLLRILMAEFWKTSGDLTVLGVEFGKGDIPSLRTKIGVVGSFLAERFPIDLTAEQIVLTGKYKSSILYREYGQAELDQAIEMLTTIKADHLIGRTYASLSQGERQLLLIARSLMEEPAILILDEATVGLDLLAANACSTTSTISANSQRLLPLSTSPITPKKSLIISPMSYCSKMAWSWHRDPKKTS